VVEIEGLALVLFAAGGMFGSASGGEGMAGGMATSALLEALISSGCAGGRGKGNRVVVELEVLVSTAATSRLTLV
jgi:hypothetical protein